MTAIGYQSCVEMFPSDPPAEPGAVWRVDGWQPSSRIPDDVFHHAIAAGGALRSVAVIGRNPARVMAAAAVLRAAFAEWVRRT